MAALGLFEAFFGHGMHERLDCMVVINHAILLFPLAI